MPLPIVWMLNVWLYVSHFHSGVFAHIHCSMKSSQRMPLAYPHGSVPFQLIYTTCQKYSNWHLHCKAQSGQTIAKKCQCQLFQCVGTLDICIKCTHHHMLVYCLQNPKVSRRIYQLVETHLSTSIHVNLVLCLHQNVEYLQIVMAAQTAEVCTWQTN